MSNLPQFTTSTKNISLSSKMRALKQTDTQQLEVDNRKMEDRLRDLKMTMSIEKEERERQGGKHWRSGQPGALTTHADEVLKKPSKPKSNKLSEKKPRKIKVLKDEPLDIPQRAPKPAISTSRSNKPKGPVCGQCEHKGAALSCMECGEDYCAGCFAQFHLKGALRKHRSVPFQANRNKGSYESLSSTKTSNTILTTRGGNINSSNDRDSLSIYKSESQDNSGANNSDSSLLDGAYDESESAAGFAAALAEWRQKKKESGQGESTTVNPVQHRAKPNVTEASSGTNTEIRIESPDIEFKDHSLSYADKLLLKKHRRTELEPMITPRLSSTTPSTLFVNSVSPRITEYSDDLSAEEAELEEEHARYVEMFQPQEPPEPRQESSLSIIEITEPVDAYGLEEATCYSVQEGSDSEIIVENLVDQPQKEIMAKKSVKQPVKPNSSRPSSRVKPGKKHKDEDKVTNKTFDSEEKSSHRSQSRTERKVGKERVKSRNEKRPGSRSKSVTSIREENKHSSASSAVTMTTSRPSSSARPPSAGITSQPSLGLQQISQQRVQSRHTYKKESLADFFMAGVNDDDDTKGDQNKDVATPSGDKLTEEKVEYKGGPALWRPLSSLSCHLEDIKPDFVTGQDFGITDFLTGPSSSNLERTHRISSTEPPKWPLNTPPPATWDDEEEFDLVQKKLASMPRPPTLPESTTPNSAKMRNINSAKRERLSAQKRDTDTSKKDRPSSGSGRRLPSVNKNVNVNERQSATHRKSTDVKKRGRRSLPPRPPSRPSSSRPCSRIDVDGDDMSRYDHDNEKILQNEEDDETLHQLEWELASQDGRITADGNISRMSMLDDIPDEDINSDLELGIKQDIGMGSGLSSPCDDFDIEKRLSEEDLMDDFEETERLIMADEVKNLES